MTRFAHTLLACACLFCSVPTAKADLIVAQSFEESGGVSTKVGALAVWFEFTTDPSYTFPNTPLFDLHLAPSDVGKTFVANAGTPFFSKNVNLATDGKNDRVGLFAGYGGSLDYEAEFFFGAPHSPYYPGKADLKGYAIDHVTLTVDQLMLNTPGQDPGHDGNWTDYSFKGTVAFYGSNLSPQTAPEPTGLCLAILGALTVLCCRGNAGRLSRTQSPWECAVAPHA